MALSSNRRRGVYVLLGAAALGILLLGFVPDPVPVEVSAVARGPLRVTSDEDAQTRARDHYAMSAPVAGRVSRIDLREGDPVHADQLVVQLWPVPLSAREREEYEARVDAARALSLEAEERVGHAAADHEQAQRDRQRLDKLVRNGFVSPQEAEQARVAETAAAAELEAARFRARSSESDLQAAQAALLSIAGATSGVPTAIALRSPVDGKVLSIADRSERVVAAGSPLVVVGDPSQLEVVIDLLSTEAVKVRPGMPVLLEGWGGGQPLNAVVRVVEPLAFTKVSALGVEEQRVNVIADFVDPPGPLGDAYRVEARVVLWSGDDVLKVPSSSLFRRGEGWSVFVVRDGRAHRRDVEVGHRGVLEAEVLRGLSADERVIRHPSNNVEDGTRVDVVR